MYSSLDWVALADQLNDPVITVGTSAAASITMVLLCRRPPPAW